MNNKFLWFSMKQYFIISHHHPLL